MTSTSRRPFAGGVPAGTPGQIIAAAGGLLALLSPLGIGLSAAGVGLLLLGVVLAAPYARMRGPFLEQWWSALAGTSLVCLAGFAAELFLPVVGGVLLAAGGVGALVVVGLSVPPRPAEEG